jgi:hypothetical protein
MKPIGPKKLPYKGGVPRHFQCRSTEVPVTRSWREMGLPMDEISPGTRRSMDGEIPESVTMTDWLKEKYQTPEGRAMVQRIFGKTKADLFMSGRVTARQMIDQSGRPLSLSALLKRTKLTEAYTAGDIVGDLAPDAVQTLRFGDYEYELKGQTSPEQFYSDLEDIMKNKTDIWDDYAELKDARREHMRLLMTQVREGEDLTAGLEKWQTLNEQFNKKYPDLPLQVQQLLDDQVLNAGTGKFQWSIAKKATAAQGTGVLPEVEEYLGRVMGEAYEATPKIDTIWNRYRGSRGDDVRAHFLPPLQLVVLDDKNAPATAVHEMTHWLEYRHPSAMANSKKFYKERTRGDKAKWLGPGYGRRERYKEDQFDIPYCGFVRGQEILSMGMELLYQNPAHLYLSDPEYFRFVVNQIGELQRVASQPSTWRF